jgi:O-antigen/teichoic acid export membrane protein
MKREHASRSRSVDELDTRILRSSGWVVLSFGSRNVLSIVSLLVLARLLEPNEFGLAALAGTFVMVAQNLQASGISAALIHRRTEIERAAPSALLFALLAGLIFYGIAFAVAPMFADVFNAPKLTDVLRVLAALLVIRGLSSTAFALLEREIDFRSRAIAEVSAGLTQMSVAVGLAASGAGVWSLVAGQLAAGAVHGTVAWLRLPWLPSPRQASWRVLRELLAYGRFVGANRILTLINHTIDTVFVGRLLGVTAAGFYSVTFRLALFPTTAIGNNVGRVMFPVYATLQEDLPTFRRVYLDNLQRIALLAVPVSVALAVVPEAIVAGLLGEKWLVVVEPLRILALYGLVRTFAAPCNEVFKGAGKPHLGLLVTLPTTALLPLALYLLVPRFELVGAALAMFLVLFSAAVPAQVLTLRLLDLRVMTLARALAPPATCALLLGGALALLGPASESMAPPLFLGILIAVGAAVYAAATALLARSVVVPMWTNLRGIRS